MTTYVLINGVTGVQTIGAVNINGGTNQGCKMPTEGNVSIPQNQAFQIVVTGHGGTVGATVQVVSSNDGVNWDAAGNTIAVTAGTSPTNNTGVITNSPYAYWGAYVTAVTGTGTIDNITCTMNA